MSKHDIFNKLHDKVIKTNLCTHCGTCVALSDNIEFTETNFGPKPIRTINSSIINDSLIYYACPGKGINYNKLEEKLFDKNQNKQAEEEFDPVKMARRIQIQDVVKSEGEAGLDKRLTHMRSQMEIEGTNKEMLASLIKSYEEKKAELEAARANGGGTVNNIAQNNSTNMSSEPIRQENISLLDSAQQSVAAANP